jgi:hypothetical protein
MSNSGVPDMLLTWHFSTALFVFVNFTMSEGTSEASAAKKRKLGQRFRPEYCIEFLCLMKSTQEHYAYCKYCKQDLFIQHGGWDNKKLSFNTCMFTYKCILCFNLLSIEIKIS